MPLNSPRTGCAAPDRTGRTGVRRSGNDDAGEPDLSRSGSRYRSPSAVCPIASAWACDTPAAVTGTPANRGDQGDTCSVALGRDCSAAGSVLLIPKTEIGRNERKATQCKRASLAGSTAGPSFPAARPNRIGLPPQQLVAEVAFTRSDGDGLQADTCSHRPPPGKQRR